MTGFKVLKEKCNQCLFSADKIVSNKRRTEVLQECKQNDSHFNCHKFRDVCCRGFFDTQDSQMIQIAKRLNVVNFVEENDNSLTRRIPKD